jgi:hypothetical protein
MILRKLFGNPKLFAGFSKTHKSEESFLKVFSTLADPEKVSQPSTQSS